MTTNQTIDGVPRELRDLLERVATEANHMLGFTYAANYDECRAAVDELRALLDAPINPLSELEVLRAAVKELEAMRDARVDAKLAQGEPVAIPEMPVMVDRRPYDDEAPSGYMEGDDDWSSNNPGAVTWLADNHDAIRAKLYAEQPAPVVAAPSCCGSCPGGCVYGLNTKE